MPFTFRKVFRPLSWVRVNVNRRSASVTFGGKNTPHYTISSTGRRTTSMNLPGPLGFRKTTRRRRG